MGTYKKYMLPERYRSIAHSTEKIVVLLTIYKHSSANSDCTPVLHTEGFLDCAMQPGQRQHNYNSVSEDQ